MTQDRHGGRLQVTIVAPLHGRAILRLRSGDNDLEFPFSYTPEDSLERLVEMADASLTEQSERVVTLRSGPEELDVHVRSGQAGMELRAVLHGDHRREGSGDLVFRAEGESQAFARCVWRSLRDIEGALGQDEYARQWHHSYPSGPVARLGQRLTSAATRR